MAKKYHLITIGCAMNQSDGERLASRLNELGWRRVNNHCQADLVILVTCGVRQSAEDRIYGLINQVKKRQSQGRHSHHWLPCLSSRH